jgi:hypothetical protein
MLTKVKLLNPMLKNRYGEYLHVADRVVADGESRGLWSRVVEGTVQIEMEEMVHGRPRGYETKSMKAKERVTFPREQVLTRFDVEKRKRKE